MRTSNVFYRCLISSLFVALCAALSPASAQTSVPDSTPVPQPTPVVILPVQRTGPVMVAGPTELYCSGFIQYAPAPNYLQIVGGEEEQEQRVYSQGDYVYINAGSRESVTVGQEYTVVRPRGQFTSDFSKKKGWLGVYTQELGRLRVVDVKERVSVALITQSCETILLGDNLRGAGVRVSPAARSEVTLDRFKDPTGKQKGRIILARDGREAVTVNQVVFIDLGTEDSIKPGDYFTIYRPLGKGNITDFRDEEVARSASEGFESERFKGGKFSIMSQRVENPNNNGVFGPVDKSPEIKSERPRMPRKIVGEMVVIGVQQRTATAIITRVAQEVHTGDYVELQ